VPLMMSWLSPSLEGVPRCMLVTLLLIPPLLFMPGDHAVAVTTSIHGVIVGMSRLVSLARRDICVYSLSALHS